MSSLDKNPMLPTLPRNLVGAITDNTDVVYLAKSTDGNHIIVGNEHVWLAVKALRRKRINVVIVDNRDIPPLSLISMLPEQPGIRITSIYYALYAIEQYLRKPISALSEGRKRSILKRLAELTDKPLEFISKLNAIRQYGDRDVIEYVAYDEMDIDEAIELTFSVAA